MLADFLGLINRLSHPQRVAHLTDYLPAQDASNHPRYRIHYKQVQERFAIDRYGPGGGIVKL